MEIGAIIPRIVYSGFVNHHNPASYNLIYICVYIYIYNNGTNEPTIYLRISLSLFIYIHTYIYTVYRYYSHVSLYLTLHVTSPFLFGASWFIQVFTQICGLHIRLGSGTICAGALDSSGSASNQNTPDTGAIALLRKALKVQECGRWFFHQTVSPWERKHTTIVGIKLGHTKMWTVRTLKFETSRYKAAQTLKGIQLCSAS